MHGSDRAFFWAVVRDGPQWCHRFETIAQCVQRSPAHCAMQIEGGAATRCHGRSGHKKETSSMITNCIVPEWWGKARPGRRWARGCRHVGREAAGTREGTQSRRRRGVLLSHHDGGSFGQRVDKRFMNSDRGRLSVGAGLATTARPGAKYVIRGGAPVQSRQGSSQ